MSGLVAGGANLWVAVVARGFMGEAPKLDVLAASNDRRRARREAKLWQAEIAGRAEFAVAVVRVPAVGFDEKELEPARTPASVEAVLRIEVLDTGGSGVEGVCRVVAVVPAGGVGAFIAGRSDTAPRVMYVGASCPLRLSWVN